MATDIHTVTNKIVEKIVSDLDDRNCGFDSIESDIKEEIIEEWKKIVSKEIAKLFK